MPTKIPKALLLEQFLKRVERLQPPQAILDSIKKYSWHKLYKLCKSENLLKNIPQSVYHHEQNG